MTTTNLARTWRRITKSVRFPSLSSTLHNPIASHLPSSPPPSPSEHPSSERLFPAPPPTTPDIPVGRGRDLPRKIRHTYLTYLTRRSPLPFARNPSSPPLPSSTLALTLSLRQNQPPSRYRFAPSPTPQSSWRNGYANYVSRREFCLRAKAAEGEREGEGKLRARTRDENSGCDKDKPRRYDGRYGRGVAGWRMYYNSVLPDWR